jgi:hypothetical protein
MTFASDVVAEDADAARKVVSYCRDAAQHAVRPHAGGQQGQAGGVYTVDRTIIIHLPVTHSMDLRNGDCTISLSAIDA